MLTQKKKKQKTFEKYLRINFTRRAYLMAYRSGATQVKFKYYSKFCYYVACVCINHFLWRAHTHTRTHEHFVTPRKVNDVIAQFV